MDDGIPYCGAPPAPGGLVWNIDPWLIAGLIFTLGLLAWTTRQTRPSRQFTAALGWGFVAVALVSPLCSLSMALFSARVTQHVLLVLVAAPLLAHALPKPQARGAEIALMGGFFAVFLWVWHLPGPYDATLRSDFTYWAMHLSLFVSAFGLWRGLFAAHAERPLIGLAVGISTAIQMSLLGALLSLARRPFFAVHETTTWPWGLAPLEDQQLGGLIMWVPGGLVFLIVALIGLAGWLARIEGVSRETSEKAH